MKGHSLSSSVTSLPEASQAGASVRVPLLRFPVMELREQASFSLQSRIFLMPFFCSSPEKALS